MRDVSCCCLLLNLLLYNRIGSKINLVTQVKVKFNSEPD